MQLFRFADPEFLYLLLLIPVVIIIFVFDHYRKKLLRRRLGSSELISRLIPEYSVPRQIIKALLLITAWVFIVLALSRPQFGSKIEEVKKQGVEVIIALDVSNSMMAQDIQPDRLTRAKQALVRLIDNLDNDMIGLIVFAGDAYTQIPVTTDYVSAKMFLSAINTNMVPKQGTAIGAAIELGIKSFTPNEGRSRAMIIITDGENHEDDPLKAAGEAVNSGITIHTIGIGSVDGVPIPVTGPGNTDFLKDADGNTVITRLDEEMLKKIAMETGGSYIRASNSSIGLEQIFSDIRKMKSSELESTKYTEYNDQYQIFLAVALFLLLTEYLIMERKNRKLANLKLFSFRT